MARTPGSTDDTAPIVETATQARQGMRGVHVLWVLIISSLLAAVALFGSWAMRSGDLGAVSHNNKAPIADVQKSDISPPVARQSETN